MDKLEQLRQQLTEALATMEKHKEKGGEAFDRAQADAERLKGEIVTAERALKATGPSAPPAPDNTAAAVAAERERALSIDALCRAHNVRDEDRLAWMKDGAMTLDAVRAKILDGLAAGSDGTQERGQIRILRDQGDTVREAVEEALLNRVDPGRNKLTDKGRPWRGMTLREMARAFLEDAHGASTRGLGPLELAGAALGLTRAGGMHGTSDFPLLLAAVANKTLRRAYEEYPRTFAAFCRQVSASDFKPINRLAMSGAPNLVKVNEAGEYKRGSIGESKESYAISTYGKVVAITRQAIINDDLDAFSRIPAMFGASAAALESDIVWALVTENVVMSDTEALFSSAHANLGTAGAISETTLSEMRTLMALQKALPGGPTEPGRTLNLSPEYLIVPPSQLTLAQKFMSAQYVADRTAHINVFSGSMTVIMEPRLEAHDDKTWYAAASPARIDTIEYAYLAGQEGVHLQERVGFDVDGVELKARHDFGAGAIDFRGLFKNPYT